RRALFPQLHCAEHLSRCAAWTTAKKADGTRRPHLITSTLQDPSTLSHDHGGVKRVTRPRRGARRLRRSQTPRPASSPAPASRRPSRPDAVTSRHSAGTAADPLSYSTGGSSAPAHSE